MRCLVSGAPVIPRSTGRNQRGKKEWECDFPLVAGHYGSQSALRLPFEIINGIRAAFRVLKGRQRFQDAGADWSTEPTPPTKPPPAVGPNSRWIDKSINRPIGNTVDRPECRRQMAVQFQNDAVSFSARSSVQQICSKRFVCPMYVVTLLGHYHIYLISLIFLSFTNKISAINEVKWEAVIA